MTRRCAAPPAAMSGSTPSTVTGFSSYELDFTTVADYYKGDPEGGYTSYVYTDYLKAEELGRAAQFRRVRCAPQAGHSVQFCRRPRFATSTRWDRSVSLPNHILRTTTLGKCPPPSINPAARMRAWDRPGESSRS